jgi:hypothetical protein
LDWLIDWLRDVLLWIIAAVGSWVTYVTVRLHKQAERIAVLENTIKQIVDAFPNTLNDLKETLEDMRDESKEWRGDMDHKLEAVRLELKGDINRESDKRRRN